MNALDALQNIAAQQETNGIMSESARVHRFLNDRIEFYRSRGMDYSDSYRFAQEDRMAQLLPR